MMPTLDEAINCGIVFVGSVLLIVLFARPCHGQELPRDRDTQVRLAQAMVAEGGWRGARDHAGVAHVLARRWRTMPGLRDMQFGEVITSYCSVFRSQRRRARWIRALGHGALQPLYWPSNASWGAHRHIWRQVLARARRFLLGGLWDPCRGRATHWGSPTDPTTPRMHRVNCGDTANYYYDVR